MANPAKGEVDFIADGQTYTLVLDFNAICELEDAFDTTADKIGEVIGNKLSNLRTVFRIGLSRHHNLTDTEAGDLMGIVGPEKAGELIAKAFTLSFPESKSGKAKPSVKVPKA